MIGTKLPTKHILTQQKQQQRENHHHLEIKIALITFAQK